MNWLFLSVAALGIAAVALRRYKPHLEALLRLLPKRDAPEPALRNVTPLDRMIDALKQSQDPLERHRLLSHIVEESYQQRTDVAINKIFLRFTGMQVRELPEMAETLRAAHGGQLPDIPAFKLLAAALEEDGRLEEAASVRKHAAELGVTDRMMPEPADGTKEGRKKSANARPPAKGPARRKTSARGKRQT